jgi:putative transposase
MTNHVHQLIVPPTVEVLSLGVGRLNQEYSRLQNMLHGRTGHLWQSRFYSCPVDLSRVWEVPAYVELNPVRAGLIQKASDWKWSSARAHVCGDQDSDLHDMTLWRQHFDGPSWDKFLEEEVKRKQIQDAIRRATSTGSFWGPDTTAERLERELGRPVRPRKKGTR